jgi:protein SCO1/2
MAVIKRWYEQELDPKLREQTKVYLVTVDPARDTPEQLKPYVDYFNPAFIGLTGEFLDLHRFATALNVPFAKVAGSDENYMIDHGASVAIISPDGYFSGFWKPPITVEKLSTTFPDIVKNLSR